MKTLFLAALAFFPLSASPAAVNWSGGAGFEGFYQHAAERGFGRAQFVLTPSLSVLDGLAIHSRLEFSLPKSFAEKLYLSPSLASRSLGLPLFYMSGGKIQDEAAISALLIEAKRIYINYETEFFILQAGRSGRHFGLGATYNDKDNNKPPPLYLKHWLTTHDQLFFYTEYGPFYIEPALLLYEGKELSALLQGGIQMESWKAEAFYRYGAGDSSSFAELFAEYRQTLFQAALSLSYNFEQGAEGLGLAFEASGDLPWRLSPKAFLKAGFAGAGFAFHPAHNASLLFQNYAAPSPAEIEEKNPSAAASEDSSSEETPPARIRAFKEGRLSGAVYFAPGLKLPLYERFELSPLALIAYEPSAGKMSYELNAEARFFLEERFALSLTLAGGLFQEKFDFGLQAASALSF